MDIKDAREEIRAIDISIISSIAERIRCAERIAVIKNENGMPIRDPDAEEKVIGRYVTEGKARGIDEGTMRTIARALIEEAVAAEERIISELRG